VPVPSPTLAPSATAGSRSVAGSTERVLAEGGGEGGGAATLTAGAAAATDGLVAVAATVLVLNVCPAPVPVCKHFAATGVCRFGDQCRLVHRRPIPVGT
jgi:hypothetical protein